jgi:hypothetical protein
MVLASLATSAHASSASPVYVEEVGIVYRESDPVQVVLVVSGDVPTPCHQVAYDVDPSAERIDVRLWSAADPAATCIQVLEPFEVAIPLGSFGSVDASVTLNDEVVGRVRVGAEPADPALIGAGWSFGYCGGYCAADLVLEGDRLSLTGSAHGMPPLFSNSGTLTVVGRARLDAALAELGQVHLEPVHGCPDCADQGAAYLTLLRDGAVEKTEMGFAAPPAELAELYDLSISLISALETCASAELVAAAADCVPYQR